MVNQRVHFSLLGIFSSLSIFGAALIIKIDGGLLPALVILLLTGLGGFIHSFSLAVATKQVTVRKKVIFIGSATLTQAGLPFLVLSVATLDLIRNTTLAGIVFCFFALLTCGSVYLALVKLLLLPDLTIQRFIVSISLSLVAVLPVLALILFDLPKFFESTEVNSYSYTLLVPLIWWFAISLGICGRDR